MTKPPLDVVTEWLLVDPNLPLEDHWWAISHDRPLIVRLRLGMAEARQWPDPSRPMEITEKASADE
jgi:hypothetical protein